MIPFRMPAASGAAMALAACGSPPAPEPAPPAPLAFATTYMCGETPAEIGMAGDATVLRVDGTDHVLVPVISASGAKYAVDGAEPETAFWSKGDRGLLTINGEDFPECVQTGGGEAQPVEAPARWTARGQEPGWILTLDAGTATFEYDYGAQSYSALMPPPRAIEGGLAYAEGDGGLAIRVLATPCADAATGLPYPDTVTVAFSDQVYQGCGGDPHALLTGADWVIDGINGSAVAAGARVSLAFDSREGRITGRSGCNAYGAEYSVGGEGIGFGPVMTTEMACANALMMQERRLYDALALVDGYQLETDGALVLTGPEGTRIVARR